MATPEQKGFPRIDLKKITGAPQAGGGFAETAPENAITPANEYKLFPVDAERRAALLAATDVDHHGIARLHNPDTTTRTSLVAVRIENHDATIVPFEKLGEQLLLPLPGHTGSRIGFFIGYETEGNYNEMAGLLRAGEFPGVPLIDAEIGTKPKANQFGAQEPPRQHLEEVPFGIAGLKDTELDQHRWAEQIGLDSLGFAEQTRRGIFEKVRFPNSNDPDQQLKLNSLIVVPDHMRDLVEHFDAATVTPNLIQILSFDAAYQRPIVNTSSIHINPYMYRTPHLGLGFGPKYVATTPDHPNAVRMLNTLQSAFQVQVVPKNN